MENHFPVTHSTLATNALMTDVLPEYDIGIPLECRLLCLGLNDTYLVKTRDGQYILRVYREGWRSVSEILYELDVLLFLRRANCAVSVPLSRKDGSLIHPVAAAEGTRYVVLFTYAPGKDPAYEADEEEEAYQYGKALARIHTATEKFQSAHHRCVIDVAHLLDRPLTSIQPFLAHRPADWQYVKTLAERLRTRVIGLPLEMLEQGFCHGDFHGGNAHFADDNTVTFFDFDCCGWGWRAYDIAVFRWGASLAEKEKERWPPFLRGYRGERPISENDLQATSYFVALRHFWLLGLHTDNGRDFGYGWMNDRYFDRAMKFFRAWEAEHLAEEPVA
jgi:Ser/Thr protein kinase RdoA (MazF antagonist)